MNSFVTIITLDFLPYAKALYHSLVQNTKTEFEYYCLICDENVDRLSITKNIEGNNNFFIVFPEDLNDGLASKIYHKYFENKKNEYRWSMKPIMINYLLKNNKADKVFYVDSDLYFFSSTDFLFNLLDENRVILSPHWRCSSEPELDWFNFTHNFKHGIYNGGFIGVNKEGIPVMDYWANLCLAACEQNLELGLHDDQKYLDIFASYFEGIEVLRHKGCNVSNWNKIECKRAKNERNEIVINGEYPIVFIHFTSGTNIDILKGNDPLLMPYLEKYAADLNCIDLNINLIDQTNKYLSQLTQEQSLIPLTKKNWALKDFKDKIKNKLLN